jgi:group I intron endonuclease
MKIYLITNSKNGKRYVGLTTRSIAERWAEHLEDARGCRSRRALALAIRKYGVEAFSVEQIAEADDWDSLCAAEIELIDSLGTKAPNGYNMTDGGEGVIGLCAESLERMRKKCRQLRHSDETKMKIGAAGRGRKVSEEAKAKISAGHTGKVLSQEHRDKLSAAKLGKKMPVRSDEHKRKISEGLRAAHKRRKDASK